MGQFLDENALRPLLGELVSLDRRYKALYREAYGLLSAGAALLPKNLPGLCPPELEEKLARRAEGLASRELRRAHRTPSVRRRFLSAVSCKGRLCLTETVEALCERAIVLDNALGLGHVFLERFAAAARERGCDMILCPDPLEPEKTEALLLPGAGLALLTSDAAEAEPGLPSRRLHLDAMAGTETPEALRALLRQRKKQSALLLGQAAEALARAKALHDELERVYRPHVDFSGAEALAKTHIRALKAR